MFIKFSARLFLVAVTLGFWVSEDLFAGVRFYEVVSSNGGSHEDPDGGTGDWLEIRNDGNEIIPLEGWGLSDRMEDPFRWTFPNLAIAPDQLLLVWADGQGMHAALTSQQPRLHTNFSISAAGETLVLTRPDGTLADRLEVPPLPRDVSFGRQGDGWFYFEHPTPWSANTTTGYWGILEPPTFNHAPGNYVGEILLQIEHPDPDVSIHYTLDGGVPGKDSPEFDDPLKFGNRTGDPDLHSTIRTSPTEANKSSSQNFTWYAPIGEVTKAHVVRAQVFKDGYLNRLPSSGTWFIGEDFAERYKLDVISIIADHDDLFDYVKGIMVPGKIYADRGYGGDFWGRHNANYHQRGPEWERMVHFELFEKSTYTRQTHGDLGMRIHGGGSRAVPQKSLRFYDRGHGSALEYPFFKALPHTSFRRLLLRNSGQDWFTYGPTMMKDAYLQRLVRHMDMEYQEYEPAVVFLNGEFWGIHNIRERIDHHYLARRYDVDSDQIDLLTGNRSVVRGSRSHYDEMMQFIANNPLSNPANYEQLKRYMDVDNFIDYLIVQTFLANEDWPGNNIDYWRLSLDEYDPEAGQGRDGRWRWILYDLDFAARADSKWIQFDMFNFIKNPTGGHWPNPAWSVVLIKALWESPEFVAEFCNRYANHLNTTFLPDRAALLADEMADVIEGAIIEHYRRWGRGSWFMSDISSWRSNVDRLKTFAQGRPNFILSHLNQHFQTGTAVNVTFNNSNPDGGVLEINGMVLDGDYQPGVHGRPQSWTGRYFQNFTIDVRAVADAGYRFSHWEEFPQVKADSISVSPLFQHSITAVFVESTEVPHVELIEGETSLVALNELFGVGAEAWEPMGVASQFGNVTINGGLGELEFYGVNRGNDWLEIELDDGLGPTQSYSVSLLVHPAPRVLSDTAFSFDAWSFLNPENSYPENMLFLQSDQDDPGVDAELKKAYTIPHDDYAAGDPVGYPYAATGRTRINGLGNRGISFINTGRERDVGGAVVAVDTRNLDQVVVGWTAGTEVPNLREYALRLQYRVGLDEAFRDVLDGKGNPVLYQRSPQYRNEQRMVPVDLPFDALNQPYVQLLFRYHHVAGDSGPRDELRLDDIEVFGIDWNLNYEDWRELAFPDPDEQANDDVSGPFADPWGTGYSNLMRYAFDIPVDEIFPTNPLQMDISEEGNTLRLLPIMGRSDIALRLRRSEDLEDWTEVILNSGPTRAQLNANGDWEYSIAIDEEVDKIYYRIEIELKE